MFKCFQISENAQISGFHSKKCFSFRGASLSDFHTPYPDPHTPVIGSRSASSPWPSP